MVDRGIISGSEGDVMCRREVWYDEALCRANVVVFTQRLRHLELVAFFLNDVPSGTESALRLLTTPSDRCLLRTAIFL